MTATLKECPPMEQSFPRSEQDDPEECPPWSWARALMEVGSECELCPPIRLARTNNGFGGAYVEALFHVSEPGILARLLGDLEPTEWSMSDQDELLRGIREGGPCRPVSDHAWDCPHMLVRPQGYEATVEIQIHNAGDLLVLLDAVPRAFNGDVVIEYGVQKTSTARRSLPGTAEWLQMQLKVAEERVQYLQEQLRAVEATMLAPAPPPVLPDAARCVLLPELSADPASGNCDDAADPVGVVAANAASTCSSTDCDEVLAPNCDEVPEASVPEEAPPVRDLELAVVSAASPAGTITYEEARLAVREMEDWLADWRAPREIRARLGGGRFPAKNQQDALYKQVLLRVFRDRLERNGARGDEARVRVRPAEPGALVHGRPLVGPSNRGPSIGGLPATLSDAASELRGVLESGKLTLAHRKRQSVEEALAAGAVQIKVVPAVGTPEFRELVRQQEAAREAEAREVPDGEDE